MGGDLPSGWRETDGRLILAQIDHLSGEELGALVEELCRIGLPGVQLSPSLTKSAPGPPGVGPPIGPFFGYEQ